MREADPQGYDPDFEVPFYPAVPIVGAVVSFALIAYIEWCVIVLSVLFVAFAAVWYLVYARRHAESSGVLAQWILDRSEEVLDAAVSAATSVQPEGDRFRVMVPLANPAHETELITLASAIAKQRDGTVVAVHIEQVPDQTSLAAAREQGEHEAARQILEDARADAETFGAAGRGVISRLASDSLVLEVLNDVDCSVLIAEKKHERTLRERLFGEGGEK